MHSLVDLIAALTLAVATAALAQFGVKVRCQPPARPALQEVVHTPARLSGAVAPVRVRHYV
jgi:hypothetical protein